MKIGIDIDEVLAATFSGFLSFLKDTRGIEIRWEDQTHHDLSKIPGSGISKSDEGILWKDYMDFHHDGILPIAGAQAAISELKEAGHSLVAITGRHEGNHRGYTEDWLSKHFPEYFDSVYFTNHGYDTSITKSSVCKNLGILLMVDDNLDFALELAENDIRAIVINKPWNRLRPESHPLLVRVEGWPEISQQIRNHV